MHITERDILESICQLIRKRGKQTFVVDDVIGMLLDSGKISIDNLHDERREISRKLSDMVGQGILRVDKRNSYKITYNFWDKAKKEKIECYQGILAYLDSNMDKIMKIKSFSEVQSEIIGEEEGKLSLPEFYGEFIKLYREKRETIDAAIDDIIQNNFDPKKLFMEMLDDYVELYRELVEKISSSTAGKERERLFNQAKNLIEIVNHIFGRVLSIPISHDTACSVCPIVLPKDPGRGEIRVNRDVLEELLKDRIVDDRFFIEEEVRKPVAAFAGVDTSVAEIDLREAKEFAYIRYLPRMAIFTTVVSIREGRNGHYKVDIYPKPEKITSEDLDKLEADRDILPADVVYRFEEYYIRRIKEAIMHAKECHQITSLPDSKPSLEIIYKDGAIWPAERKFDDFLYDHKEFVIDNLTAYYKMVKDASESPLIVGVVKRGHLGFLWYLVNWYINRKMNKIDVRDLSRFVSFLERRPESDGYLALIMLSRYAETKKLAGKGVRLFAIKRKFYATDAVLVDALLEYAKREKRKIVDLEKDEKVWQEIVWSLLIDRDRVSKGSELKRFLEGDTDALKTEEYWQDLEDLLKSKRMYNVNIRTPLDYINIYRVLIREGREDIAKNLLSTESQKVYDKLPYILSHADIVFLYYLPPYERVIKFVLNNSAGNQLSLPRFEIQLKGKEITREEIRKMISRLSVMPFPDFYAYYGPEENVDPALIIPVPVMDAHLYAKGEMENIKEVYFELLRNAIDKYLKESGMKEIETA
ncbi:MAG: hypothetical protein L7H04_05215 [Vulcanisaeta sp.]|nr:hypothetical protein [Vulcanisaeta sp.]MCG2909099.1 hypothetical protein [Stygiolobus sp.]